MGLTSGAQGLPLRQASEKDLCKKDLRLFVWSARSGRSVRDQRRSELYSSTPGMKSVGRFVDGAACRDTTQSRLPLR